MAAVARLPVVLLPVLLLPLAGCASTGSPAPAAPSTQESSGPRLVAGTTSGSAEVGSFEAASGDLWVGGRCTGGDLEVRVDPVAVLPIPCGTLAGSPFLNQIILTRSTTITVSVSAAATVTWDLKVQQG